MRHLRTEAGTLCSCRVTSKVWDGISAPCGDSVRLSKHSSRSRNISVCPSITQAPFPGNIHTSGCSLPCPKAELMCRRLWQAAPHPTWILEGHKAPGSSRTHHLLHHLHSSHIPRNGLQMERKILAMETKMHCGFEAKSYW